jgi:NAD(P)-dependent dehydrogenase (short-subunit alcohol dehydrogenase family)
MAASASNILAGKLCLLTGGTAGIGIETAIGLARRGARLVIVGRDPARAAAAISRVTNETGNKAVEALAADFSTQSDVHRLATEFRRRHDRLDILVNNAGAIFPVRTTTVDGYESNWAVNHMAPALLTLELVDLVKAAPGSRIVNVSSSSHVGAKLEFDDLQSERGYGALRNYGRSKLAALLFSYALANRLDGSGVTLNCLHPGAVASDIGRNFKGGLRLLMMLMKPFLLSSEQGALTSIYVASTSELAGISGCYFEKSRMSDSSKASHDRILQERIWTITLQQLGRNPNDTI